MTIQIQCSCGQAYAVKDSWAGKTVRCKECGAAIEIPTSAIAAEAEPMSEVLEPDEGSWASDRCCDKSGFLFKHACDRLPVDHCQNCGRPVCNEHSKQVDGETTCSTCVSRRSRRDRRRDESGYGYWPYSYGPDHYAGYDYGRSDRTSYSHSAQNDPNDFTDADGESLVSPGDQSFETDLTES